MILFEKKATIEHDSIIEIPKQKHTVTNKKI